MKSASEEVAREKLCRMEILSKVESGDCVNGCEGGWYECALEVLTNNSINPMCFAAALRELIEKGRGKFRNLMIVGPANCGKTFLLAPLQVIFRTFSNPANDKYAWLGVESSECIFLNEFRWSSELIAWKEFLLLFEGQQVHLPSPKNLYAKDISIDHDVPIFATGKSRIRFFGRHNATDEREDEMM